MTAAVVPVVSVMTAVPSVVANPLTGQEVFDIEEVVRAPGNVQQRGHRGHFFDLFLRNQSMNCSPKASFVLVHDFVQNRIQHGRRPQRRFAEDGSQRRML